MPIYLDEIDIGQQRMQAVEVFFQTVNTLRQVQRDKELTIGFNQIDRDADIQIDEILSTQQPEQQEYYIGQIKRNARRRKMDMMAQAGEFEPVRPKQGGSMGLMQNILRAFSPTDTTGVTDTPLIQQIQKTMLESQFPSTQDELSQEYMRERIESTKARTDYYSTRDEADLTEKDTISLMHTLERALATTYSPLNEPIPGRETDRKYYADQIKHYRNILNQKRARSYYDQSNQPNVNILSGVLEVSRQSPIAPRPYLNPYWKLLDEETKSLVSRAIGRGAKQKDIIAALKARGAIK